MLREETKADSLTTSQWLSTKEGKRALRESILPALERTGVIPEGSALAYREPNPLREFLRRLLTPRRAGRRASRWEDEVVGPDDASPHESASSYGKTTSSTLPQSYMQGHSYGDTPKR